MSKPIITKQMLIDADACPEQVDLFEEIFGDSVVVTISRAKKVARLFDWVWATRLLDAQGRAEYDRVKAPAWDELDRAIAPAWAEYLRATATALAEFNRVKAPAWAKYQRADATAWAEYKRVIATGWATAFIDMHKRGASK